MGGERHGLDLDDGAEVAGDAEAEDVADFRLLRGTVLDVLIEAADLRDFVNVVLPDDDEAGAGFLRPLQSEAVGVGQEVDGLAPFHGVVADEGGDAVGQRRVQFFRGVLDNADDVGRGQGLEVNLGAAGAERRADVPRLPRGGADQDEVGGRALVEEFLDIGRHFRVGRVVIGGLEIGPLVLQDF